MTERDKLMTRRAALRCMAFGGAGTAFAISGGVLTPFDLASAAARDSSMKPLFVQISDTHIGFRKEANPDVAGTLNRTIELVNAMPVQPQLLIHTGDITHLSTPAQFDQAQQLFGGFRTKDLFAVPGEHDTEDPQLTEFTARFGHGPRHYYSFDHAGVHFIGLINVLDFKAGGLGTLGDEQLAWVAQDLKGRSASTPIVVFAHMPLWTIYEPWGWGTGEGEQIAALLRRFGSVTVLNGHIHQIVQKVEGNILFHTARSTAYPQPAAGVGSGPGPLLVPPAQLPGMLGVTLAVARKKTLTLTDSTLA